MLDCDLNKELSKNSIISRKTVVNIYIHLWVFVIIEKFL